MSMTEYVIIVVQMMLDIKLIFGARCQTKMAVIEKGDIDKP